MTLIAACLCLGVVTRVDAARGIRFDTQEANGWDPCSTSNPCPTLPSTLLFNPFGTSPSAAPAFASTAGGPSLILFDQALGGPDAQTPCADGDEFANCPQGWTTHVPGIEYVWGTSSTTAQVVFFNLSGASSETVYSPTATFDSAGNATNALGLVSASTTPVWEIEFNYDPLSIPSAGASLSFNGTTYTTTGTHLSGSTLDEFVYYNGTLYKPDGWVATTPLPDSVGLLGAGLCAVLLLGRRLRKTPDAVA